MPISSLFESKSLKNCGKSSGFVWKICPQEVPRVIRLSFGAGPSGSSDYHPDHPFGLSTAPFLPHFRVIYSVLGQVFFSLADLMKATCHDITKCELLRSFLFGFVAHFSCHLRGVLTVYILSTHTSEFKYIYIYLFIFLDALASLDLLIAN